MRATDLTGTPVYRWTPNLKCRRQWYTVRRRGEQRIRVLFPGHWRLYVHSPGKGWALESWGFGGRTSTQTEEMPLRWKLMSKLRKLTTSEGGFVLPALPAPTDVFVNRPTLCAFLTETEYEDKTPRLPGQLSIRNKGACFEVTAYDVDSGLRLPVVGPTLRDALQQLEALLNAAEAPWEIDRYLHEMAQKRKKKKK